MKEPFWQKIQLENKGQLDQAVEIVTEIGRQNSFFRDGLGDINCYANESQKCIYIYACNSKFIDALNKKYKSKLAHCNTPETSSDDWFWGKEGDQ